MTQAPSCATEHDPEMKGAYGVRRSETHFTHDLTPEDIIRAGEAVLMMIGASVNLGHVSPNGLMDYTARPGDDDPIGRVVWDALASTRIGSGWDESRANLIRFSGQRGLLDAVGEAISR